MNQQMSFLPPEPKEKRTIDRPSYKGIKESLDMVIEAKEREIESLKQIIKSLESENARLKQSLRAFIEE